MSEWRVTEVVGIAGRHDQIGSGKPFTNDRAGLIPPLHASEDPFSDLAGLNRVGKARTVKVAFSYSHYLCLCLKASECGGVYDAPFVALIWIPFVIGARHLLVPEPLTEWIGQRNQMTPSRLSWSICSGV
jgi:hypothetical protein